MIDYAQIRQIVPLREFIEFSGTPLRADGQCFRGKCPFHGERRGASLIVYPDGRWYCHGKCHCGGDVVRFAQLAWELASPAQAARMLLGDHNLPQRLGDPFIWRRPFVPAWPERDLLSTEEIVRSGIGLCDLDEASKLHFNPRSPYASQAVEIVLPGNPFLCIGKTDYIFATRRRKVWDGHLHKFPLIVPNPMRSIWGVTQNGEWSQHSLDGTCTNRVYLVIEFDFSVTREDGSRTEFADLVESWAMDGITTADACSALIWHLANLERGLPLVMVVHSGGKSLHGWFKVFPFSDERAWPFMRYAYQIGADHVTWLKSQFVRIPGGCRQDGARQQLYFLNPENAVKHEPRTKG